MILIGAMSNLFLKAVLVAVLGHRSLFTRIAVIFGIAIAAGVAIVAFWPA